MCDGKVYGVVAIKGGVGKTTVATNIGSILSNDFNKRVLVIDANFLTPHLGLSLGLTDPENTLHDALNGKVSVFDTLHKHSSGFYVIPGSLNPAKINPLGLKKLVSELEDYFDLIIIDSSPSLNDEMLATIQASDQLLVVTSPDYPTLSSTIHAVNVAKQNNTPIMGLIINKSKNKSFEINSEDIEYATDTPVISIIPDDYKVMEALSFSTPTTLYSPKRRVSREYRKLGASMLGEEYNHSLKDKVKLIKNRLPKFDSEKYLDLTKNFKGSSKKFLFKAKGGVFRKKNKNNFF